MSVENVSLCLVPQGQKASNYRQTLTPCPKTKCCSTAEKTDFITQGLEFLFSPLLEEYYNPTHGLAEENNNDQAPNASVHQDDFFNPFCMGTKKLVVFIQEMGESSHATFIIRCAFISTQRHVFRWTRDHPLEQVRGNPTMPVQTRRQLATDLEMCMFALTVSIVEPKNIKEAMADSAWIKAMQDELHQRSRSGTVIRNKARLVAKVMLEESLQSPKGVLALTNNISDADHAGCIDTRKSTSGGIQFLGDKLVSWMSKKQNCTAMSSAEAEYVALSASCAQVENGIIELYFVRTEYQLADMFTKALPEDRFKYLVRRIGMRCLTPADLEVLTNETA
ncbi:hypothetical protein Tco_0343502 [Tanacetum coccineum]